MNRLKTLRVVFDTDIRNYEISQFRGAMVGKVGKEHEAFHNHNNSGEHRKDTTFRGFSSDKFHYRYPVVQYKTRQYGRRSHPMVLCLNEGVAAFDHFTDLPDWNLDINGEPRRVGIKSFDLQDEEVSHLERPVRYNLFNWLALNGENYLAYKGEASIAKRYALLERLLTSQIKAFMKGTGLTYTQPIVASLINVRQEKWTRYKGVKLLSFDVEFQCPLSLPEYIGIGKGAAMGFGVLRHVTDKNDRD